MQPLGPPDSARRVMQAAAERAKRALAGGSGAEPQVRVRVSVYVRVGCSF